MTLRQGVGWRDGIVGSATVSATDDESQAANTLRSEVPVVVEDLSTETRFGGPDLLTDHDVLSGVSTIIGSSAEPWGVLGAHDTDRREFTARDGNFLQSVVSILASAIARHSLRSGGCVGRMLRRGFEPRSLPREGNMIGRTTLSERVVFASRGWMETCKTVPLWPWRGANWRGARGYSSADSSSPNAAATVSGPRRS